MQRAPMASSFIITQQHLRCTHEQLIQCKMTTSHMHHLNMTIYVVEHHSDA